MILAILGLALASIPLGIWGVVRTKNRQRRGRGLAIASFVIIGVWAVVGAAAGVILALTAVTSGNAVQPEPAAAPPATSAVPTSVAPGSGEAAATPAGTSPLSTGDQPTGPLRKTKRVYFDQLKVGDCFKGVPENSDVARVTRVDCRVPHQEQVTGIFDVPGGRKYPGEATITKVSDARCLQYFARFVGVSWDNSTLDYSWFSPDAAGWTAGDHSVICTAEDPDHPEDVRISFKNLHR